MGALTDLFAATAAEAAAFAADAPAFSLGPGATFETVELPRVDIVLLGQLMRALPGVDPAERLEPVGTPAGEGPWLFALPPSFTDALATVDDEALAAAAAVWAGAPEWRLAAAGSPGAAGADDLAGVLRDVAELARRAAAGRRSLYLWWSL